MELNREQCIEELDFKIKYSKFVTSEGVLLSTACAQFCLEHAQLYEAKIRELTEENKAWQMQLISKEEKADKAYYDLACELSRIKEDTVRKMQERLDKHFCHDPAFLGVEQRLIMDAIDQIAKEMLEENNEV